MREHLSFANVMSCVAVFIALGGTAMAIKANSVGSRHVKNESLRGIDVKKGSLKGKHLAELTLTGREIDPRRFPLGAMTGIAGGSGSCQPSSTTFVQCGFSEFSVPQESRVLVSVAGEQTGPADSAGSCHVKVGAQTFLDEAPVRVGDSVGRDELTPNGFALTAASTPAQTIPPGPTQITVLCNQTEGDVEFRTTFSVLALASRRS